MAISLPSCDLFNKVTKRSSSEASVSNITNKNTSVTTASEKKENSSKPKHQSTSPKDVEQDAVLPRDREHIAQNKTIPTYTSEDIAKGILKGDWAIESVNGKSAVGEKAPFIRFAPTEKMIYGNNGCNVINGSYKYNPADSTISFSNIASTMMLCHKDGLTDYEINAALDATKYYSLEIKDNDFTLYFLNSSKKVVMSLMHQNFQFLNGTWLVTKINSTPVDEPDMKLVIDVDEGKIHGNTGCNILNGSMEIDMEKGNSISFSGIATTRMACPPGNHQTELLVALEEASTAKPLSKNAVVLRNDQGDQVLQLERTGD